MATEDVVTAARLDSPPELDEETEASIQTESKVVEVTVDDKTVKIHSEQSVKKGGSPKFDVLLLHSAKYTSKDWKEIKTPIHLANWGYKATVIDLPGKGESPDELDESLYGRFLAALVPKLSLGKVVIIAPAESGKFAFPYLFDEPATSTDRALGFVCIAPDGTHGFTTKYPESQVPTVIMYGSKDIQGAITLNDLQLLPKHEIAPLEGAGHACYIDKPEAFHKVLFHFLNELKS